MLSAALLISDQSLADSRFVNISVDQVRDNATGLIWQTRPPTQRITHDEALRYCEKLLIDGMDQWRLPQIKELASIIDEKSYNPSIYHYFKTEAHFYWSATDNAADSQFAWLVNFSDSHIHSFRKNVPFHVRCVRPA